MLFNSLLSYFRVAFNSFGVALSKRRNTSAAFTVADCIDFNSLRALESSLCMVLADLSPEASALDFEFNRKKIGLTY